MNMEKTWENNIINAIKKDKKLIGWIKQELNSKDNVLCEIHKVIKKHEYIDMEKMKSKGNIKELDRYLAFLKTLNDEDNCYWGYSEEFKEKCYNSCKNYIKENNI